MARIDETRPFIPVSIEVLTVSDTRTAANDTSGDALVERIAKAGHRLAERAIEKDDAGAIEALLRRWVADPEIDVVITTGGTGITGRDVTPEATRAVIEKELPGFGEVMRSDSFAKVPTAILSRATAGVRGKTLIVNLPGNPKAIAECLPPLLPAIVEAIEHIAGVRPELLRRQK